MSIAPRFRSFAVTPLASFLFVLGVPALSIAMPPHPAFPGVLIVVLLLFAQLLSPQLSFCRLVATDKRRRTVAFFVIFPVILTALQLDMGWLERIHICLLSVAFALLFSALALRLFAPWIPVDEDEPKFGPTRWR